MVKNQEIKRVSLDIGKFLLKAFLFLIGQNLLNEVPAERSILADFAFFFIVRA